MSDIKYLVGSAEINPRPLPAFSEEAIDFLSALSGELLKRPDCRTYPDIVSVAYWCRRGNLRQLQAACPSARLRLGKGLAFHVAPSNIPVNFAFSFFFSLLAGNANIVRVPSKAYPQIGIICAVINTILPQHPEIAGRTAMISYPVDDETTAHFCAMADLRIIWGGDHTIAEVRKHPTKPRCIDMVFADRYSLCILDAQKILETDEPMLARLANGFYNDTYLMDQNACSSPQLILWLHDCSEGRERFWNAVCKHAAEKYVLQPMTAMDKFTQLCEDAVKYPQILKIIRQHGNLLYRVELSSLPNSTELRGRGGYFYECALSEPDDLAPIVTEKYQTLTYFGIEPEELRAMVLRRRLCGIDRIVPVGNAMDIGIIWDGYDVVSMLSRLVDAI